MQDNSFRQSIDAAKVDIADIQKGIRGIGTEVDKLNTDIINKLTTAFSKTPQEVKKKIVELEAALDKLTKKIDAQKKAYADLQIKKKELSALTQQEKQILAAKTQEDKKSNAEAKKQIKIQQEVKRARESAISKQLTGQMIEYVNSIGKTSDALKKMRKDYQDLAKESKKAHQEERKARAARNKAISKEMTGRMKEYVNSIGKTSEALRQKAAWYRELEAQQKQYEDSQKRIADAEAKVSAQISKNVVAHVNGMTKQSQTMKDLNADYKKWEVESRKAARQAEKEAKAAKELASAYNQLKRRQAAARDKVREMVAAGKDSGREWRKARRELDVLTAKLNKANHAVSNFNKTSLGGMVRGVRSLMAAFGIVGGAFLFANIVKSGFKLAKTLDSIRFAMETVITDSDELARTQMFLIEITEQYGAELVTTTERYNKFLAAAKQSNVSLSDTEKIFGTMTKAAGSLGLKTHELEGVYLALEQMLSKGKVTTEELRRQLGERLPGAFGIMAKAVGVSVGELDDMLKKGEILAAEVLPKFADEVEKAYGLDKIERVENLNASTTRLSNAWVKLVGSITRSGGPVSTAIMGMIDSATIAIDTFRELNMTIEESMKLGQQSGSAEAGKMLEFDTEKLGHSSKRSAQLRLPQLEESLVKYERKLAELTAMRDKDRESQGKWIKVFGDNSGFINWFTEGVLDNNVNKAAEMVEKYKEMIRVFQEIEGVTPMKDIVGPTPWDENNLGDVTSILNVYGKKLVEIKEMKEEVKKTPLEDQELFRSLLGINKQRLQNLEKEKQKWVELKNIKEDGLMVGDDTNIQRTRAQWVEHYTQLIEKQKIEVKKYRKYDIKSLDEAIGKVEDLIEQYTILAGKMEKSYFSIDQFPVGATVRTYQDVLDEIEEQQTKLHGLTKAQAREQGEGIRKKIEDLEKEKEVWDGMNDQKKKGVRIMKGSLTYWEQIKSQAEQERDGLIRGSKLWQEKVDLIEEARAAIFELTTAIELQEKAFQRYHGNFSMEGTAAGIPDPNLGAAGFGQHQRDDEAQTAKMAEAELEVLDLMAKRSDAIRKGFYEVAEQYHQKILDSAIYKNEEELAEMAWFFDRELEMYRENAEKKKEIEEGVRDFIMAIGENILQARIQKIDDELAENREYYAQKLASEEWSVEQRDAIEAERDAKEAELNKKKRKREKENFLIQQGMALAGIAINLAQTIAAINLGAAQMIAQSGLFGMALAATYQATAIPLAIQSAAVQGGIILAQTIPQFEQGTDYAPEGLAVVDEKRPEVHTDRYGNVKSYGSEDGPNLRYLKRGDKIIPSRELFMKKEGLDMNRMVFEMNMEHQGRQIKNASVDNAVLIPIMNDIKSTNENSWREVKKLASRPINVHNEVKLTDERHY